MEIREILETVAKAFEEFKKSYSSEKTGGELFEAFTAALAADIPGYSIKYDFLCGPDTVNIDGITDGNYRPQTGDTILIDTSVTDGSLWCDVCRTFFVGGYNEEQKRAYELIRESVAAGEKALRAGACAGDIYDAVNAVYKSAGEELVHHAGHMIGTEPLMQPQFLTGREEKVAQGSYYTIESGLYKGFGIRLENDYYISEKGAENLFEDLMPLKIEDYILK